MGGMRNEYNILVGKPGILSHIWHDYIQLYLRETEGGYGLDASRSGYGPVAGSFAHGNEPSGSINAGNLLIS
jgi:hypothetical protein